MNPVLHPPQLLCSAQSAGVVFCPAAPIHQAHIIAALGKAVLADLLLAVCWWQRLHTAAECAWLAAGTLWRRHDTLAVAASLWAVARAAAWAGCKKGTAAGV